MGSMASNDPGHISPQPDLSAARATLDFVLFMPGVTASLLVFVVFGTTRTFRDYAWRRHVPGLTPGFVGRIYGLDLGHEDKEISAGLDTTIITNYYEEMSQPSWAGFDPPRVGCPFTLLAANPHRSPSRLIHYRRRCPNMCAVPIGEQEFIQDSCSECHILPDLIRKHYDQLLEDAQKEYRIAYREGRLDDLRELERRMKARQVEEFEELSEARRRARFCPHVIWPGCREEDQYVPSDSCAV
ncbi:hypothetical protein GQ53DRAFT_758172 [Thozetella sp. PMI_491]|nr:hypothetical protein GQ53DRAFT_758172 [Thozetella sp. PMI_491]